MSAWTFDAARAAQFARIALANVVREYPNHPGHVLDGPGDAATPRTLHPVFYGSYDWHSCVHMHWLLARVQRLYPDLPECGEIACTFNQHFVPAAVTAEAAYFGRPGLRSFERTYGWAWLLALAAELCRDPYAARWSDNLRPLVATIIERYFDYLPRARYPIRYGVHSNSAFGLAFAVDFARVADDAGLAALVSHKALDWFFADSDLPAHWEPSGADFFSPALIEADLMRRVLPPPDFAAWLSRALPGLEEGLPATLFRPAEVSDRGDPQIVHLDGLNLSRAWCFRGVLAALPASDRRRESMRAAAELHVQAGLQGLGSADYFGEHWLATFATVALST
jgi:hypothetical protein